MTIKWSMDELKRIFGPEEVFSSLAVYHHFKNTKDYQDNIKIKEIRNMFVTTMQRVPDSAMESLHGLFDKTVDDFSEFVKDPSVFAERVKTGFRNPVENLTSESVFKDAVRAVLIFRIAEEKKMELTDAAVERDRTINRIISIASTRLEHILGTVAQSLIGAKESLDLTDGDVKRLSLRVLDVFDDGLETQLLIDGMPIESDADFKDKLSKNKSNTEIAEKNNPMYG
tara:strand:+ start:679 stop:1359 length:681 start_codon:yes stop_codon:yes gene_type:complete